MGREYVAFWYGWTWRILVRSSIFLACPFWSNPLELSNCFSCYSYFLFWPCKEHHFFISDGEEGIHNVAVSDAWKQAFCNSPAYWGNPKGCHNYPIGSTAWAKNPTLDLKKVKLVLPGCSLFCCPNQVVTNPSITFGCLCPQKYPKVLKYHTIMNHHEP